MIEILFSIVLNWTTYNNSISNIFYPSLSFQYFSIGIIILVMGIIAVISKKIIPSLLGGLIASLILSNYFVIPSLAYIEISLILSIIAIASYYAFQNEKNEVRK